MNVTRNSNMAPDSKAASNHQFLAAFHWDIAVEIFSYLTQEDCLTCMTVCCDWYRDVPQYSQNLWREIELETLDVSVDNPLRQRCLGSHVRSVAIDSVKDQEEEERPLVTLMERLLDWGCTEIEYLELRNCTTTDVYTFINMLKQLGSCLKHLKLNDHESSIAVLPILTVCRELTHLTYTYIGSNEDDSYDVKQQFMKFSSETPSNYRTKITHLYLNVDMVTKKQLENILKICPELRCFISVTCNNEWEAQRYNRLSAVDIDILFSWCPKVVFLVTDFYYYHYKTIDYPAIDIRNHTGLYCLNTTSDSRPDHLSQHLAKNQDTLEQLSISKRVLEFDWSSVLGSLWMPNLRELMLNYIVFSHATLITLLNRCPSLEILKLDHPTSTCIESSDFQLIHTMPRLVDVDITHCTMDALCISTLFERLPALQTLSMSALALCGQLPIHFECPKQLRALNLCNVSFITDGILEQETSIAHFLNRLASQTKLEVVSLVGIRPELGLESLRMVTMIPMLKELEVHYDRNIRDEDLVEFIRLLGTTKVKSLTLQDVYELSFGVLDALATLPLLQKFRTDCIWDFEAVTYVPKEGLRQLLRASANLDFADFTLIAVLDGNKVLERDQVTALIEQQTPRYNIIDSIPGHWEVHHSTPDEGSVHGGLFVVCVSD